MNNIQVFNNPEFGDIRTVEIDGEREGIEQKLSLN